MKASILYEMITKKRNPWTQTLVTYRFVNASLHVYITITIKEQNEVVVCVILIEKMCIALWNENTNPCVNGCWPIHLQTVATIWFSAKEAHHSPRWFPTTTTGMVLRQQVSNLASTVPLAGTERVRCVHKHSCYSVVEFQATSLRTRHYSIPCTWKRSAR